MYFPHYFGSAATVNIVTSPAGLSNVPSFTFDPAVAPASRVYQYTFTLTCQATPTTYTLSLSGDTQHYSLSQTLVIQGSANPIANALLRFNFSNVPAPRNASLGIPGTVHFNGWNQFIDLNQPQDTALALTGSTIVPADLVSVPTDNGDWTRLIKSGWSIEGWYQPTSFAHSHGLFSISAQASNLLQDAQPSVLVSVHDKHDYGYGLSFEHFQQNSEYMYVWWSDRCNVHAPLQLVLYQWFHWGVTINMNTRTVQLYFNGQPVGGTNLCTDVREATRTYAYAGKDHMQQRYAHGNMATLVLYDWPLSVSSAGGGRLRMHSSAIPCGLSLRDSDGTCLCSW